MIIKEIVERAQARYPKSGNPESVARAYNREFELELAAAQGIMFKLKDSHFNGQQNCDQAIETLLNLLFDEERGQDRPGWP